MGATWVSPPEVADRVMGWGKSSCLDCPHIRGDNHVPIGRGTKQYIVGTQGVVPGSAFEDDGLELHTTASSKMDNLFFRTLSHGMGLLTPPTTAHH
jgi:hypothetical protein